LKVYSDCINCPNATHYVNCLIEDKDLCGEVFYHPCKLYKDRQNLLKVLKNLNLNINVVGCYDFECIEQLDKYGLKDRCNYISKDYLGIYSKRSKSIKIVSGCNNKCSFCFICSNKEHKMAEKNEIFNNVELLDKEVTFTGENVSSHKDCFDIVEGMIESGKKVGLTYTYPKNLIDNKDFLIRNKENIYLQSLPIQHVSTRILELMNRSDYDPLEAMELINYTNWSRVGFLVGHPEETKEEFNYVMSKVTSIAEKTKKGIIIIHTYRASSGSLEFYNYRDIVKSESYNNLLNFKKEILLSMKAKFNNIIIRNYDEVIPDCSDYYKLIKGNTVGVADFYELYRNG